MRRAFFFGACIGALVFIQGLLILRLPVRVHLLQLWALACGGVFGLTLSSLFHNTAELTTSMTFAAVGLVLFYGIAAVLLRGAYRSFRRLGVVLAAAVLLAVHFGLYLLVIRSVAA
jgi:hypothetical protein